VHELVLAQLKLIHPILDDQAQPDSGLVVAAEATKGKENKRKKTRTKIILKKEFEK